MLHDHTISDKYKSATANMYKTRKKVISNIFALVPCSRAWVHKNKENINLNYKYAMSFTRPLTCLKTTLFQQNKSCFIVNFRCVLRQ